MIAGRRAVTAGIGAVLALAACTAAPKPGPTKYVTVAASPPSTSSAPSPRTTSASPSPSIKTMRRLPGTCDDLLPAGSVMDALGHDVPGYTAFVVGEPDPSIGRISYLNCRYGTTTKAGANPQIEIGVSLYHTPKQATARIQPTIDEYAQHGASATQTTVAGKPATLLTGGSGAGYGPTLVMADGQRTIAVTLRPGAVPTAEVTKDLTALAALADRSTAPG